MIENSSSDILAAIELEQRYRLSFWDSLIVRAAQIAQVETLYSEDLSHGQTLDNVQIINPFVETADIR